MSTFILFIYLYRYTYVSDNDIMAVLLTVNIIDMIMIRGRLHHQQLLLNLAVNQSTVWIKTLNKEVISISIRVCSERHLLDLSCKDKLKQKTYSRTLNLLSSRYLFLFLVTSIPCRYSTHWFYTTFCSYRYDLAVCVCHHGYHLVMEKT